MQQTFSRISKNNFYAQPPELPRAAFTEWWNACKLHKYQCSSQLHPHTHTQRGNKKWPPLAVCVCVCGAPPLCILGSALRLAAFREEGFVGRKKLYVAGRAFGFWDWYFGFGLGVATNGTLLQLQSLPPLQPQSLSASTAACCCLSPVEAYFLASPMCVAPLVFSFCFVFFL